MTKYILVFVVSKEGPFKIEAAENGKYTLCDDSGITVKSGRAYGEDELKLYDPFA